MEENNIIHDDEITLRELIETLIKYRILIAIITLIVVACSAFYTYGIQEDKFVAKTTVTVRSASGETDALKSIDDIINYMNSYPLMTVESFVEQILTPQVLYETIRELELKNSKGDYMTITALTNMIEVINIEDTNLITIEVTNSNAELAAQIANSISSKFISYTNEKSRKQSQLAAAEIAKQLVLEEANVEAKSKAVTVYLANHVSIEELSSEVNSLISQVTGIKADINDIEISINQDEQSLNVLLNDTDLATQSLAGIEVNLSSNQISQDISFNISNENELQTALLTMEITNQETRLISHRAGKEAREVKLADMQVKLIELQTTLAEQEYKFNSLNRELQLANQTYNAYQSRHKEAIVAAAANIGTNSINVNSEAMVPVHSVSTSGILILMIGLILGLMIGIFVAFFKAYWEKTL
jgi:uncharacterized protein involved in exopolysaccharide biosynthesis